MTEPNILRRLLRPDRPPRRWVMFTAVLLSAAVLFVGTLERVSVLVYENPRAMFEENAPATYATVFLLGWCAITAFVIRRNLLRGGDAFAQLFTWLAVAFTIAAADDALRIHEFAEDLLHTIGPIRRHPLNDKIDDVVVGVYGLALLGVGWRWRRRILGLPRMVFAGVSGAAAFATMMVLDVANGPYWAEEGAKILAAACFLSALLAAHWSDRLPQPGGGVRNGSDGISTSRGGGEPTL